MWHASSTRPHTAGVERARRTKVERSENERLALTASACRPCEDVSPAVGQPDPLDWGASTTIVAPELATEFPRRSATAPCMTWPTRAELALHLLVAFKR